MNWIIRTLGLALLGLVFLGGSAFARDVRIEVRVTSAAGSAVYVDRGSANGLAEGDRVEFRFETSTLATGVVRALTSNSARVEIDPGSARPPVGTRGEVRVPDDRAGAEASTAPDGEPSTTTPVEHPPWTHPPETWDADRPLLAPAFGIAPEDRDRRLFGRAWLRFNGTSDVEGDRTYGLVTLGTDATLENPFGSGGALRLDVEAFARSSNVSDGLYDYDDTHVRVDRFAYEFGGTEDRPDRFQVGRFWQHGFSELGLLDGAEWSHRTEGGSQFGASLGYMPEPFADLNSFQDLQAAVHYRHAFDPAQRATLGVAYQNTWHEGVQDRNLVVAAGEVRPSDHLSLRATAWVDFYDSTDTIKGSGAELTEARISATWTAARGDGVSVYAMERRIPELLRDEFLARRADDMRNSVVDRVGVNGWTTLGTSTRIDARLEQWSDEDDEGLSGEIGATFLEVFGAQSSLSTALQWADGSYSSGPGARIQARDTFGSTSVGLGWQSFWFSQKDFGGDDDQLAQHSLFGTVEVPLSDAWDLSLLADRSIGDHLDSWTVGFMIQTHF